MSNVPKLRFKEFSGEFEYDILDELFTITSKKFDPTKHTDVKKCVELEHLSQETGNLLGHTNSNEQASIKNSFEKGQVLFGKLRPYLKKFWQANFDGVCSSEIWVLNGKKLTNSYLYHLVQTHKFNQISNVSSGSKMPRADWQYMSQVPFSYPIKQEQEKIASFLTSVDTKIEQLTKKEKLLSSYKKGVMQKIFSGEIRFKADDGSEFCEWEEKALSEVCDLINGYAFKSSTYSEDGDFIIITIKNVQSGFLNLDSVSRINSLPNNLNPNQYLDIGDILISMTGNVGRVCTVNIENGVLNQRVGKINPIDINRDFLFHILNCNDFISQMIELGQGGAQPNIGKNDILSYFCSIPQSKEEQTKIANFLSSIDSKIEQVQKQLDSAKEFKKALLQQMFV